MADPEKSQPIICQRHGCNSPIGKVQNGVIVIIARHDGEKHVNVLRIEDLRNLIKLLQEASVDTTHAVA